MYKVKFADIGEGLTEGKVTEVLVKMGEEVKDGQSLFSVETDKVTSDIPSPVKGKISKINISVNQEIKVGDVVIEIDDGSSNSDTKEETKEEPIEENASVVGSTPVSNKVIQRNTNHNNSQKIEKTIKASPLARKIAAELNVDLSNVKPSGPNQRILVKDVQEYNSNNTSSNVSSNTISSDKLEWDVIKMNGVRKATVKAMVKSSTENAAFTGMKNIDITETFNLRNELKEVTKENNIKLTYLAFIIKAAAKSLSEMPNINVRGDFENNQILQMKNINIGIAVDTPDGLMVPVIKNVNNMPIFEIAKKIDELAQKARNKKLAMSDMKDATFTISNFGSVGLDYATPIINSPESAILGIGNMIGTPMYINDQIEKRYIMPFSMTCDHRIIDGADAGRFLIKMQNYLSKPILLFV